MRFDSLFLIAGPCVIESETLAVETAGSLKEICERVGINLIYKSSYDKANRSSFHSFRGLGLERGLQILETVRKIVPVVTDVHEYSPLSEVASVVDMLQTPAFLCRQTDFIQSVARQGLPMNVKKGQFMAPWDMANVVKKCHEAGNDQILLCERGTTFGYNNLVTDMRSLPIMAETGPVVFDATHSVQQPGSNVVCSGGDRRFAPVLARAAVAAGASGLFIETHPYPERALSDGATMIPLGEMEALLEQIVAINCAINP